MISRLACWISVWMSLVVALGACGDGGDRRYQLEHRRLLYAERHIRKAEAEIRRLQRERRSQALRITRLERELARVRSTLQRERSLRRGGPATTPPLRRAVPRAPAKVVVSGIRFWERRHRSLRRAVRAELTRLMPRFKHCYKRLGWGRPSEPPLREAFWVIFGVRNKGVGTPRLAGSSLRRRGNTAPTRRLLTRALTLESCMRLVLKGVRLRRNKSLARVAVLLSVAETGAALKRIRKPAFKWPWKRVTRRWSGLRQVCRVGRRHRFDLLTPQVARPCRKGLRCCYPCGIPGCDSICLRRCPRGLP